MPTLSTTRATPTPVPTSSGTFSPLLRKEGVDIVIVTVAELMGRSRLDTTRGYTLPTEKDLEDAVSRIPADR